MLSIIEPLLKTCDQIKIYKSETDNKIIDYVKCGENFTRSIKLKDHIVNLKLNDYWHFPMIEGNRLAIENYKRKLNWQQSIDPFDSFIYLKGQNNYCKLYELKKQRNNQHHEWVRRIWYKSL